jgi:hypothetical protein
LNLILSQANCVPRLKLRTAPSGHLKAETQLGTAIAAENQCVPRPLRNLGSTMVTFVSCW